MNFQMLFALGGGLGLFLYGMNMMGDGLEKAAGSRMKRLLEILTTNRLMGVLVGLIVTAIIQSSSASTVMVVGFVNAGLMNLSQATGVILGANIGTTITAQLIALNLTDYAPIAIFVGVAFILFAKKRYIRHIGEILAGFGILFLGMDFMSKAMVPLRDDPTFQKLMTQISNPILGVLAGAIFTAIIQSSSASIGILQALAMQGLVDMNTGIFILFGMNIGTCVTAMLASIGTGVNARRAAVIHLIFNIITTSLFIILITAGLPFVNWMQNLTPGNVVKQIANSHTAFNVFGTVITLPVAGYLAFLAKKIIPGEERAPDEKHLEFLDKRILETPTIAVAQIVNEVERMGDLARTNLSVAMDMVMTGDIGNISDVIRREEVINYLNREITDYMVMTNSLDIPERDRKLLSGLFHVVNDIERIGDHSENLVEYAQYLVEHNLTLSDMAIEEMNEMKNKVLAIVDDALVAMKNMDIELAKSISRQEDAIDALEHAMRENHIERLNKQECTPGAGVIFLDVINNLERIADHADNISKFVMDKHKKK
ncbi:MAG: Na/Pi cotransporter family protein [Caldicoprobacterales bacterium]|jgi:phosphate:Na+ symporter